VRPLLLVTRANPPDDELVAFVDGCVSSDRKVVIGVVESQVSEETPLAWSVVVKMLRKWYTGYSDTVSVVPLPDVGAVSVMDGGGRIVAPVPSRPPHGIASSFCFQCFEEQAGFVVWLTGLPSSGKSTIASRLWGWFNQNGITTQVLDGDTLRAGAHSSLGFSRAGRIENIRRAGRIARTLQAYHVGVIAAFITPYRGMRASLRRMLGDNYVEVYVRASRDECIRRDVKGLWGRALRGEIENFTGVGDRYEAPLHPDLTVDTEVLSHVNCVNLIVDHLKMRGVIPK